MQQHKVSGSSHQPFWQRMWYAGCQAWGTQGQAANLSEGRRFQKVCRCNEGGAQVEGVILLDQGDACSCLDKTCKRACRKS